MRNWMSYGIALAIIIIVGLWMATGTFVQGGNGPGNGERSIVSFVEGEDGSIGSELESMGLGAPETEHSEGEIDPHLTIAERVAESGGNGALRSVRIENFTARPFAMQVPLRGRTEAKQTVAASAQTSGIVETLHVEKGDRVEADQLLCTLDRGTRQARVAQAEASLAQAEAGLEQAQADFDTNAALRERELAPANTARQFEVALSAAEASLKAAQSALDEAEAELDRTEIRSRVAGIVQDPMTTVGALLNVGGVCASIVELDPIIFVGNIPEANIGLARTGLTVHVETVSGQSLEGTVTYIASTADEATRSFRAEVEIPNPDGAVRDGLTANAEVELGVIPAHLIPQSVLTLDDDGKLGVRAVVDSEVVFHEVTIVSDTRDGMWVTGLPSRVDIITLGQENVQAGQMVDAAYAETDVAGADAEAEQGDA